MYVKCNVMSFVIRSPAKGMKGIEKRRKWKNMSGISSMGGMTFSVVS